MYIYIYKHVRGSSRLDTLKRSMELVATTGSVTAWVKGRQKSHKNPMAFPRKLWSLPDPLRKTGKMGEKEEHDGEERKEMQEKWKGNERQ